MSNPIQSVGGVTDIPCPSTYLWELEDTSGKGAGRTEEHIRMNKMRLGQLSAFTLAWQGLTTEQAHLVLTMFNPEYIMVSCLDPLYGGYVLREYYVGNRSAGLFDAQRGLWNDISFRIVQREDENA